MVEMLLALNKTKFKLSEKYDSLYSKEAHLNHGLNEAIQNKIQVHHT